MKIRWDRYGLFHLEEGEPEAIETADIIPLECVTVYDEPSGIVWVESGIQHIEI